MTSITKPTTAVQMLSVLGAVFCLSTSTAFGATDILAAMAVGVVGTGTAASCTEAALDAALAGGGNVTFNCGASPVTITVTGTKAISTDTTIDGGGLITISGGDSVFSVNTGVTFTVQNLTIANGSAPFGGGFRGGAIDNGGTLTITSSTFSEDAEADADGG